MLNAARYRFGKLMRELGLGFDASKDPAVQHMLGEIDKLKERTIVFSIEFDKDGNWAVESKNLPGLITGGNTSDNFDDVITDAIFTYFNIAPQYCDPKILTKSHVCNSRNTKSTSKGNIYSFGGVKKAVAV